MDDMEARTPVHTSDQSYFSWEILLDSKSSSIHLSGSFSFGAPFIFFIFFDLELKDRLSKRKP